MKKKKKPISIGDAIAALIRGEYDKPIVAAGNQRNRTVLRELEALRISVCKARNELEKELKQQRVDIASVAHDLKTPLAIISGYAECLQDGIDDKDYLALIAAKTQEMNGQVISLVEATRRDVEQSETLERESIFAPDYFTEEAEKYHRLAEDKILKYKVGNVPAVKVYASRDSLSKILQNLISNAVKYSPQYRKVTILFVKTSHYLRVSVADTGIGIGKADLKHVFERFYTADKARTNTANSGLGLYITKQTVEELGGHVAVKSKKGKGSTFYVYLPLDETDTIQGIKTPQIDNMPRAHKILFWLFCGWFMTSVYRFMRYSETRQKYTLWGAFILLPFFAFGWIMDLLEIIFANKVSYFC